MHKIKKFIPLLAQLAKPFRKHKRRLVKYWFFTLSMLGVDKKIFCISMQRSGTTSVGKFFRDHGFRWSGWPDDEKNRWSWSRREGDYEKIFCSLDFRSSNAFEDSPWWGPEFYKVLFHRFPNAKFILLERDEDAWYESMCTHSHGDIIGTAFGHCKMYRREYEYYDLLDRGLIDEASENTLGTRKVMKLMDMGEHYKNIYRLHNREVKEFFQRHERSRLFAGNLEDPDKWQKLGRFLGVDVAPHYDAHENKSL